MFAVNISWLACWRYGGKGGGGGEDGRVGNRGGKVRVKLNRRGFRTRQSRQDTKLAGQMGSLCPPPPPPHPFPPLQGSQDSTGGQEGLVAPPFSAFPPPPPPQNGLPGTEFGPGAMFAAGGQGTAEVGAGANGPTATTASNTNSVSAMCSENLK